MRIRTLQEWSVKNPLLMIYWLNMEPTVREKLRARLKQLRKQHKYTQAALGERAGIRAKSLQRLENKNPPSAKIDTLEKLAKAFGMSLSEFLRF